MPAQPRVPRACRNRLSGSNASSSSPTGLNPVDFLQPTARIRRAAGALKHRLTACPVSDEGADSRRRTRTGAEMGRDRSISGRGPAQPAQKLGGRGAGGSGRPDDDVRHAARSDPIRAIVLLVFFCMEGTHGPNPFGRDLKGSGVVGVGEALGRSGPCGGGAHRLALCPRCPCGEIGRRDRLKIGCRKACWFESGQGHHFFLRKTARVPRRAAVVSAAGERVGLRSKDAS